MFCVIVLKTIVIPTAPELIFLYIHNFTVSKKVQWGPAASSFSLGNAVPPN